MGDLSQATARHQFGAELFSTQLLTSVLASGSFFFWGGGVVLVWRLQTELQRGKWFTSVKTCRGHSPGLFKVACLASVGIWFLKLALVLFLLISALLPVNLRVLRDPLVRDGDQLASKHSSLQKGAVTLEMLPVCIATCAHLLQKNVCSVWLFLFSKDRQGLLCCTDQIFKA